MHDTLISSIPFLKKDDIQLSRDDFKRAEAAREAVRQGRAVKMGAMIRFNGPQTPQEQAEAVARWNELKASYRNDFNEAQERDLAQGRSEARKLVGFKIY